MCVRIRLGGGGLSMITYVGTEYRNDFCLLKMYFYSSKGDVASLNR